MKDIPTKPPIGIEPERIWKQKRLFALIEAVSRYSVEGFPVKDAWLYEIGGLVSELIPEKPPH